MAKRFSAKKMLSPEPDESTTGEEVAGRTQEEKYADEAWLKSNKAHKRMTTDRRLEVLHVDWASEAMGGSLYARTMWILQWGGNDSFGGKTNRGNQVETELGIALWGRVRRRAGGHFHHTMVGEVQGEFHPTRVGDPIWNGGRY